MKHPNYFLSIAYNLVPVFLAISLTSFTTTRSKFYNQIGKLNKKYTNTKMEGGQTPLHLAVISNDKEWAEFLLKRGAKSSKADKYGHSALHYARKSKNKEMEQLLTDKSLKKSKDSESYIY